MFFGQKKMKKFRFLGIPMQTSCSLPAAGDIILNTKMVMITMIMVMLMTSTRTNINVWDLAAETSVYSWDGHGDWVQVVWMSVVMRNAIWWLINDNYDDDGDDNNGEEDVVGDGDGCSGDRLATIWSFARLPLQGQDGQSL